MGDLHVAVIDDVSKVVGWEAVALHDDVVIFGVLFLEAAVDEVVDRGRRLSALKADGKLLTVVGALIRLLGRDGPTRARIERRFPGLVGGFLVLLQRFG